MLQNAASDPSDIDHIDGAAQALLEVVTELALVMDEENRLLAEGMPAGVVHTAQRKNELAADYAALWENVRAEVAQALVADPEFSETLIQAVGDLREIAAENVARLEAAVVASRRRVEAALAALRDEAGIGRPYGADGETQLARYSVVGTNFHI
jgi:hypothetical protein